MGFTQTLAPYPTSLIAFYLFKASLLSNDRETSPEGTYPSCSLVNPSSRQNCVMKLTYALRDNSRPNVPRGICIAHPTLNQATTQFYKINTGRCIKQVGIDDLQSA